MCPSKVLYEVPALVRHMTWPAAAGPARLWQALCRAEEGSSGIVRAFFGPEGKHSLALAKFAQFLTALHDEVVRLEFCHYAGSNEV